MICHVVRDVLEGHREDLATLERDVSRLEVVRGEFQRITYDDAVERLNAEGEAITWGDDFGAPHEAVIGSWSEQPVMVHRWPKAIKAFYMAPDPEDERLVLGVDIIAPEGRGEIVGGAQRASDLAYLERQIATHDLPMSAFDWYLDLRRYGACSLAGFGLGLERLVSWISGVEHVRECIPFPRTIYRIAP
jgi:asparaginyl-tRNA synthetase